MTYMSPDADTAFYPCNGADCPERLYNGLGCVPPAEDAPPDPHGKERQGRERTAGSKNFSRQGVGEKERGNGKEWDDQYQTNIPKNINALSVT